MDTDFWCGHFTVYIKSLCYIPESSKMSYVNYVSIKIPKMQFLFGQIMQLNVSYNHGP